MRTFSMTGNFKLGSQWRNFKKEVEAETKEHARELLFKTFGGKYSLPRRFINVIEIAEIIEESVILDNNAESKIPRVSNSHLVENGKRDSKKIPSAADD